MGGKAIWGWLAVAATGFVLLGAVPASAALPPVPVPRENPVTEPKRVLGKILFWDEQLSSDNSVACGTCHRPGKGGGDARRGTHPLTGDTAPTFGSPGVQKLNDKGMPIKHALFGFNPQIGDRTAPSNFDSLWATSQFWDGRAGPALKDPISGKTMIASGGALETQALGPLMNPAEMARDKRAWPELQTKLAGAKPLALASNLPPDTAAALAARPTYPKLFVAAFGDPAITPSRIVMALAAYERTLVADQTPYDLATKAGAPTDPGIQTGLTFLEASHCTVCHKPPLFTDNLFHNIGVRRAYEDEGHATISGLSTDAGAMKTPSLRNAGLRVSFMHTGEFTSLSQVVDHYVTPKADADPLPGTREPYKVPIGDYPKQVIIDFITTELTDPRVAAETFPFDRPTLRSERADGAAAAPGRPEAFTAHFSAPGVVSLSWKPPASGAPTDYRLIRDGRVIAVPTTPGWSDPDQTPWLRHRYRLEARNDAGKASGAAGAGAGLPSLELAGGGVILLGAAGFWLARKRRRRV